MSVEKLRVVRIVEGTSVDGPGLRTSIYFAGCSHRCPGCHNQHTWDFDGGDAMSVDDIMAAVRKADFNVTLTGGDPLQQRDLDALYDLCVRLRAEGYGIWCYTGYMYESLAADAERARFLDVMDVLVDGPFVESLRDVSLRFRGSSNQRLVNLRCSRMEAVVLWSDWPCVSVVPVCSQIKAK